MEIIDRYTTGIIFTSGYGRRIESMEAEVIGNKVVFINFGTLLVSLGRFWVDTFSRLKYVPRILAPWKRTIKKNGNEETAFSIELVELARADLRATSKANATGEKRKNISSFTESILSFQEQSREQHLVIEWWTTRCPTRNILHSTIRYHSLHDRHMSPSTHHASPLFSKLHKQCSILSSLPPLLRTTNLDHRPSQTSPAFPTSKL